MTSLGDWFKQKEANVGPATSVPPPAPDLSEFKRSSFHSLNSAQMITLAAAVEGMIGPGTRPEEVPFYVLEAMSWDPVIYMGEQAVSAPIKDPELYWVKHEDPAVVAETEEWLNRLLPDLLPTILQSFFWGAIPYVWDWNNPLGDLVVRVNRDGQIRNETRKNFVYPIAVHEIYPGDVQLKVNATGTKLEALVVDGVEYKTDRAFLSVWDRRFGEWYGRGSRRRAYKPWFESQVTSVWFNRWLERSVDPPRIGYAPKGKIKIDSTEYRAADLLTSALMSLKNGGATVLPSGVTPDSNQRAWGIEVMELPDRSDVWHQALSRHDAQKLIATLVPPASVGVEEATFAGARVPTQVFIEFIQCMANFVAAELTKLVCVVHLKNRGTKKRPPEVKARDIPAAKQKLLLEIFRIAADVERQVGEGKVVTLAELVDDEIIELLGMTKRPVEDAAREASKGNSAILSQPPSRDLTSAREERRDNAREPEGEDATGAPEEGIQGV